VSDPEQPAEPGDDAQSRPGPDVEPAAAGTAAEPPAGERAEPDAEPAEEPATAAEPAEPVLETGSAPQAGLEAEPEPQVEAEAQPEPAPATPEPAPATAEPAPATPEPAPAPSADAGEADEVELVPRQKPEIPGADLVPDIVTEPQQFLDAEARAAAEAEAEAAAAAAREEVPEDPAQPIADAAIDLAAGARYRATGKRKTAVARVLLKPGSGTYTINGKTLEQFFPRETLQRMIRQPLETVGYEQRMDVVARMHGGGVAAQAGALRHGISRALIEADPHLRGELKRRGFLTRDPRVKERKKAGLKKARKRPQFSKR
jgi:small subunit ribosomal protein S9